MDLDDLWSYMKTHADSGWESYPSFLHAAVPRVLQMLGRRGLKCTFFITGKDASFDRNGELLQEIVQSGHEAGNHSFSHDPWFHLYSDAQVEFEIAEAEKQIERTCGRKPSGFRAPGYSLTRRILKILAARGYLYDSSTLPSSMAALARAYYFTTKRFSKEEIEQRKILCGSLFEWQRPIRPYRWKMEEPLLELPITTFPLIRTPIHASYLYALFVVSKDLALVYLRTALGLIKSLGIRPVMILHPPDFLGADDGFGLAYFPAMTRKWREKADFMERVMDLLQSSFECMPLGALACETDESVTDLVSPASLPL
jgi:hypothetical protein